MTPAGVGAEPRAAAVGFGGSTTKAILSNAIAVALAAAAGAAAGVGRSRALPILRNARAGILADAARAAHGVTGGTAAILDQRAVCGPLAFGRRLTVDIADGAAFAFSRPAPSSRGAAGACFASLIGGRDARAARRRARSGGFADNAGQAFCVRGCATPSVHGAALPLVTAAAVSTAELARRCHALPPASRATRRRRAHVGLGAVGIGGGLTRPIDRGAQPHVGAALRGATRIATRHAFPSGGKACTSILTTHRLPTLGVSASDAAVGPKVAKSGVEARLGLLAVLILGGLARTVGRGTRGVGFTSTSLLTIFVARRCAAPVYRGASTRRRTIRRSAAVRVGSGRATFFEKVAIAPFSTAGRCRTIHSRCRNAAMVSR